MTAVRVGVRDNGVTAMHDATECGIWGGDLRGGAGFRPAARGLKKTKSSWKSA